MTHYISFILRITLDNGKSEFVKGQIQHTKSGQQIYFLDWAKALAFIECFLHPSDSPTVTEGRDQNLPDENNPPVQPSRGSSANTE